MTVPSFWQRGWREIFGLSLLLFLLVPLVLGVCYPLFLAWPACLNGFWVQRPEFIASILPAMLAALALHLLGSWSWFVRHAQDKHAFEHFALERHLGGMGLGAGLAGQAFLLSLGAGLKLAVLAYGVTLWLISLLWLAWPMRHEPDFKARLTSPWLGLWAVLQSLALLLIFTPQWLVGAGCWVIAMVILPWGVQVWQAVTRPASGRPWLRLSAMACAGLMVLILCYAWLRHELETREQQLVQDTQSHRQTLLLQRQVLRGQPLAGNGFESYWTVVGNHCNLKGAQAPMVMTDQEGDRVRSMFDLRTGVLVPDSGLLERYAAQLDALQQATQYSFIQYPFSGYLLRCHEDLPRPNIGVMQDMLLLQLARGLNECNQGQCALGARHMLDAARVMQDLPVYGEIVPMMVAYKLERILISSLGKRMQPGTLRVAEWQGVIREWSSLLQAESGLFAPVLAQELLLAQQSLIDLAPGDLQGKPESVLDYPAQLMILPYVLQGLPELKTLMADVADYLSHPAHDPASWQSLIDYQKALARLNPFVNNVLIDVVLALQRYREHQVVLRGFYQYLALQAYFAAQGHYPEHLQELVPAWIPALPLDPYTGKVFVYRRNNEGFALYSLGENQLDDGGDGYYGHFVRSPACSGKEQVFAPQVPKKCVNF